MAHDCRRSEERKRSSIHAFASDLGGLHNVKCVICDMSTKGCRIVSNRISELPDVIQLIPEGFEKPIRGVIVWRRDNMAGISLEHEGSDDVRSRIEKHYASLQKDDDDKDDTIVLGRRHETLSYRERLENYHPTGD